MRFLFKTRTESPDALSTRQEIRPEIHPKIIFFDIFFHDTCSPDTTKPDNFFLFEYVNIMSLLKYMYNLVENTKVV